MKAKFNTDYNGVPLTWFAPEPDFVTVTLDVSVDVTEMLAVCFDHDADIYFNGDDTPTYVGWPKNEVLQLTNKINAVVFSVSGTLMYMSAS